MERVLRRKSKSSSKITQGNQQIHKQKAIPKLASESSSFYPHKAGEDLGQSSSKCAMDMPMKKLLAEEMTKDREAKRSSPSVIVRLMGLDGFPSQQPIHRQQKKLLDNYRKRTSSIGSQRSAHLCNKQSHRTSSKEQQEFKDVLEDLEASHVVNRQHSSKQTANLKHTKSEVAFIQQKAEDGKHITADGKVHGPKKFDANEKPDSNNDLMVKLLKQPDSIFVKHMHGIQGASSSSMGNHIAVLKPSRSDKYEAKAKGCSNRILENDIVCHSYKSHDLHNIKQLNNRIDGYHESRRSSTNIIILKPDLGKACNAIKSYSSPESLHSNLSDCRKHTDYSSPWAREEGYMGKLENSHEAGLSRSKCKEAREIARKVATELKERFGSMIINLPSSLVRESSEDMRPYITSGSDRTSVLSDLMAMTSRFSSDWNNCQPSIGSTESVLCREAKKRLLERWKTNQKYEDVGVVGKSSTLGEMLSIPYSKMRNLDLVSMDGTRDRFSKNNRTSRCDGPLDISSNDGWKDKYLVMSSRSRSLPHSSRSHKVIREHEARIDDKLLMLKEAMYRGRSKAVNGKFYENSPKKLIFSNRKSQSICHRLARSTNSSLEVHPSHDQMQINFEKEDPTEEQPIVSQTPNSVSSIAEAVANTEHQRTLLAGSSDEFPPKLSACILKDGYSSVLDQKDSNPQESSVGPCERDSIVRCSATDPESSESSKEADHPSPVSVLEVSPRDDVSSAPECFEQLSADLHGLRIKLQLLKMESDEYSEESMLMASNDAQGSTIAFEDKGRDIAEGWELSYIVNVLNNSGLNDTHPNTFMTTWHSPDCPLGHWVFDKLENNYCMELRPERKLLFDRINSALFEISQPFMDPYPWVRPSTVGSRSKWQKGWLWDEVHYLLGVQEKDANNDIFVNDMHWRDSREGIDLIGMEIEKLLIDDLITEVVSM